MRAARALDMLLILQREGRTPARRLADALEVSERTILRDVEVLSEAGVPVLTRQGVNGGIELLDGFETNLTGLTTDEALCVLLVGQPQVAHRLGLGAPTRVARAKLLTALSEALTLEAEGLDDWFVHDPDPWEGHHIPHGELRRISNSIRRERHIELMIASRPRPLTVRPLGLVLKAGSWHLVHLTRTPTVLRLDELRSTRLTARPFRPPSDFELSEFWAAYVADASTSPAALLPMARPPDGR